MDVKLFELLGIEVIRQSKEKVVLKMPVDERTHQPAGYLHGGCSVLLAETAASIGGTQHVDLTKQAVFGMEINANHIKSKRDGVVTAIATPLHIGKSTMVWDIKITDENDDLIAVSRCTLEVVTKSS